MLKKNEIMSVGSIVKMKFRGDSDNTIALIIGHLMVSKEIRCHYDYICVEFPFGIEKGVFCINHSDIVEVLHQGSDYLNKNSEWLEFKYAEFLSCYQTGSADFRREAYRTEPTKEDLKNILGTYAVDLL